MPYQLTEADRQRLYEAIFANIPLTFLDPAHPDNEAVIGAIAWGLAHVEEHWERVEAGLFLDTATTTDILPDGLSNLARWARWLGQSQLGAESEEAFRDRLQARMYGPRVTIEAIETSVSRATGFDVFVTEPADDIWRIEDGPGWEGKKILGDWYDYGAFQVNVMGATNMLRHLVPHLRAAGFHWRSKQIVLHQSRLEPMARGMRVFNRGKLWQVMSHEAPYPSFPGLVTSQAEATDPIVPATPVRGHMTVANRGRYQYRNLKGSRLLESDGAGGYTTVLSNPYQGAPTFNWDDPQTPWDQTAWPD